MVRDSSLEGVQMHYENVAHLVGEYLLLSRGLLHRDLMNEMKLIIYQKKSK